MTSKTTDYSDLIPEYCQGLLDSQTKALFEQELEDDEALREETDEFIQFEQLYQETTGKEPQPTDTKFNAILSSIDINKKQNEKNPSSLTPRLLELWDWLKNSVSIPWGVALIQTAAIVILVIPGSNQDTFKTLSRTSESETSAPAISFNIVFTKSAQEEEIRKLLLSIGGNIISGPSAQGLYVIALTSDTTTSQALEALNNSVIVTFSKRAY